MSATATRYTLEGLCAAARERGFDPSERLVKDWVGLGLLDRADRRGRGRGRGVEATWPENQKDLLLLLLDKRRQVKRIVTLCNIPVAVWLWWGDDYVPTRQALRALSTWAGGQEKTSWGRAEWTAEQLVERYTNTAATPAQKERLIKLIAGAAYGGAFEAEEVQAAFEAILDPRWSQGPEMMRVTAESLVFLVQARLTAIKWLRENAVDEKALAWARSEYLTTRQEYAQHLPRLVEADPERAAAMLPRTADGQVPLAPTLEEIVNNACIDLLTLLGIHQLGIERGRADAG